MPALVKVSPATVSTPASWNLFDRSTKSGFLPGSEVVAADLDSHEQISAVKIYGSSPYRLHVRGRDGANIGLGSIDLSKLGSGWNVVESRALISTNRVELRFEPLGALASVPEIEFWALDRGEDLANVDLSLESLPPNYAATPATFGSADISPGECATFDVDMARAPSTFEKAYLVYEAEPLFRSFSLRRSINGLAEHGGVWMPPDVSRGARPFVDEVAPAALRSGSNTCGGRLCGAQSREIHRSRRTAAMASASPNRVPRDMVESRGLQGGG